MTKMPTIVFVPLLLISTPAVCASAPAQLQNKTIRVNWSVSQVMKLVATRTTLSANPTFERIIYVGSSGRLFVRSRAVASGRAAINRTVERGPEESGSTTTFQGNQIVSFASRPGDGVATRLTVSFDQSFSSCTATVSVGKVGAKPKITGIDGSERELIDASASAATCSINEGNGLAGQ